MTGDRVHTHAEVGRGPGKYINERFELGRGGLLLLEVALAGHEKVTRGVVVGPGVPSIANVATFVDMAVSIDEVVVGDVGPASFAVGSSPGAKNFGSFPIVLEEARCVVNGETIDSMLDHPGFGRSGAPGLP